MNIAMWRKALVAIPRLNKEEWNALDVVSRWLIATRAAVLIITSMAAAIAGLLAYRDGVFDWLVWLIMFVGLVMAHATNNLLNDVTDYLKGVDRDNYFRSQYGPQPLEHGLMSMREVLTYTAITGLIAVSAGIALVVLRGMPVLLLMALGAFFVLFYTYPLKYVGMGEVAVLVVWGPLMIGGGYYVLSGVWAWDVVVASLPYALGTTTIIFGKHIDKLLADSGKHVRTLPVLLGERISRYAVIVMMVLQHVLIGALVATGFFAPTMLVVLLAAITLVFVARVYLKPRPETMPADYRADVWPLWFVAFAFLHHQRFGLLFLIGLLLEIVLLGNVAA
jgi:1,4-dihydroxy-2-naphthoate octaprenyltransferase